MKIGIGKNIKQKDGFSAFILNPFPPDGLFDFPQTILLKTTDI